MPVVLFVTLSSRLLAVDAMPPKQLSRPEIRLLNEFAALKPGITEEELRQRLPELSVSSKPEPKAEVITAETSTFHLAGLEWQGIFYIAEGKFRNAVLCASASYQSYPGKKSQTLPRHEVRAIGLLITSHFASKYGKVVEGYVPNLDCPAGNPFGLRHSWRIGDESLTVEFFKVSSSSSLQIEIADWKTWEKEQQEVYGNEKAWPLKPASKKVLLEVSQP